ncbi:MAG: response regulator transcription factor [Acidimicrobiales bacterium]
MVDDHELFLDALAHRLTAESSVVLVGRETNLADARLALAHAEVDVLVVAARLDRDNGLELISEALRAQQVPAAVVMTGQDTVQVAAEAVRAGARGFVSKCDSVADLIATVAAVHRGETHLPNRLLAGILEELQRSSHQDDELVRRLDLLTDREREVLAMLASGIDRQTIAARLFISAHTVRTHVQRILTKLGVHSQLEAVSVALRAGLQPDPAA